MEDKVILNETPPNWEAIVERFPAAKEMAMNVVITYYPHIYIPGGMQITPDVRIHENIHLYQQRELGVEKWWEQYLTDDDFRLSQEVEAYGAQLAVFKDFGTKVFEHHKNRLAQDLSSQMYGAIISFGQAASKIRRLANEIHNAKTID